MPNRVRDFGSMVEMLTERFGEPLVGDGQGVPTSSKRKRMGNRGFGAKFEAEGDVGMMTCGKCGGMLELDADSCTECGMMPEDGLDQMTTHQRMDEEEMNQVAPPGREDQVKALKRKKGIRNPWAVAWNSYDRS